MAMAADKDLEHMVFELLAKVTKPHPVHGLSTHPSDGSLDVVAFIEQAPQDQVKCEVDKASGFLCVDRPHKFSSLCPVPYGFIPRTYCGVRVAKLCQDAIKSSSKIVGDGDPLDICVLSTRPITRSDLILHAQVIGGMRMVDNAEADDKIIAVVRGDAVMNTWKDIKDVPKNYLNLIHHFFLSYKSNPVDPGEHVVEIPEIYGRQKALDVIEASKLDYTDKYGNVQEDFKNAIKRSMRKIAEEVVAEQLMAVAERLTQKNANEIVDDGQASKGGKEKA